MATIEEISTAFYDYSYKQFEEELNNSDKPSEKNFPTKSEFSGNFQDNINVVYNDLNRNYPSDQASYIYRTFIANLNKQSQNPGQSRIVNASKGTINVENLQKYSKKVQETLKARHPEKFETVNDKEVKVQNENKTFDFNNPEEKKSYVQGLIIEYSKLETEEERENFIKENIAYNYDKLDEEEQKIVKDKVDIINTYIQFKSEHINLEENECKKRFLKENEEITEKDLNDVDEFISDYTELTYIIKQLELDPVNEELKKRKQQLSIKVTNYMNREKAEDREIENMLNEETEIDLEIPSLEDETEQKLENNDMFDLPELDDETEQELENDNIFDLPGLEDETEIDLENEDEFDLHKLEKTTETIELQDKPISEEAKKSGKSQILASEDFEEVLEINQELDYFKESYQIEINDENKGLWNRIKNTFSKIKNTVIKRLNLNQNKSLKGQELLDTAENNVPSTDDKVGNTNSWELSQYGITQEEVLQNTQNAINNSENDKSNGNSNIRVVSDQEINI